MQPRLLLLPLAALAVLVAAAIALLGDPSAAGELPPPDAGRGTVAHGDAPDPEAPDTAGGAVHPSDVAVAEPVYQPRAQPDTSGWTSGVIAGDIPLTTSVLDQIQSISVVVDELRNITPGSKPPFRRVVNVPLTPGTPTFTIKEVPFSAYGYVVRVHSPGLNGGQATVQLTKDAPLVEDLRLPITPACPFSLRLRDQDHAPIAFTEVRLVPVGEPLGRSRFDGTTDNFGSLICENILAGDYQVHIGPVGEPLMEPPVITVQPGAMARVGNMIEPQGIALTVPRGQPVIVTVTDMAGYPVEGARVRLLATDRVRLTELIEATDFRGQVHYANVQTGMWEVEVQKRDHQTVQRQFTIKKDEVPAEQKLTLVRLR